MTRILPYGRQTVSEADIAAVVEVLRSDYLTSGPKVQEFEQAFAAKVGARHAVAVNSGTAALHLALLSAGVGPGDRVITSPNTFLASANCAAYVGAVPDFADIDPVSHNLDPAALVQAWQPDTKAVVAVDYAGQPCDLPAIAEIARARGAVVIDDACHGVGGALEHGGKAWKLGGNPWADFTVFSFHPLKNMTTGEGGMLTTDNGEWAERCRRLRSHGVVRAPELFADDATSDHAASDDAAPERGPWYYEMRELGFNYRLPDILCALGVSQLARLDALVARRRAIVARYNTALANIPWLQTPGVRNAAEREQIAWHLYAVEIDFPALGKTRTEVMHELRRRGIGTQVHYIPIYLQPWYRRTLGYAPGKCPIAEQFYRRALSLPLFPAMEDADVEQVIAAVRSLA